MAGLGGGSGRVVGMLEAASELTALGQKFQESCWAQLGDLLYILQQQLTWPLLVSIACRANSRWKLYAKKGLA